MGSIATKFENIEVTTNATEVTITGQLVQTVNGEGIGIGGAKIVIKVGKETYHRETNEAGVFTKQVEASKVPAETTIKIGFAGYEDFTPANTEYTMPAAATSEVMRDKTFLSAGVERAKIASGGPAPAKASEGHTDETNVNKQEHDDNPPSTFPCEPCTDLISTAKRVLRDPKANAAISEYILGMAGASSGPKKNVLEKIAKVIEGRDALKAVGESCRAQIRLEMWTVDAISNQPRKLQGEELREIDVHLLEDGDLADVASTYEEREIFFSSVTARVDKTRLSVLFSRELTRAVSPVYLTSDPDSQNFTNVFIRDPHQTYVNQNGVVTPGNFPNLPSKWVTETQLRDAKPVKAFELSSIAGSTSRAKFIILPHPAHVRVFSCVEGDPCCLQGSCVDEDCRCSQCDCPKEECSCTKSKQYISKVAITASSKGSFVKCGKTSDSGCLNFDLTPGWYQFSAPEEVKIEGCNYTLCSSSPISVYLGANQFCSDIFFCYKKKGTEIEVISEIEYPDPGNPYKEARNNLPGMQYLLLRECDPSFIQQQTTKDGSALRFENVPAGTYLLLCQGPPTYNSQPVEPVDPEYGRMALRVFAGQAHSKIPVSVKFRQSRTTPAVLAGFVRDNTGSPVPQTLVQAVTSGGAIVAAGLTDANGLYSFQIYKAENLTIVAGTQQIAVSKSEIQADMSTGPKMLPSPRMAMLDAVEATLMPELNS
jgi:hypothetical protein